MLLMVCARAHRKYQRVSHIAVTHAALVGTCNGWFSNPPLKKDVELFKFDEMQRGLLVAASSFNWECSVVLVKCLAVLFV